MLFTSSSWLSSLARRLFSASVVKRQRRRLRGVPQRAAGESLEPRVVLSAPTQFLQRGISGGGVMLEPALSPHNPNELFVGTDMSQMFHSKDGGQSWDIYNFNELVISNKVTGVQFTSDPQVLFAIDQNSGAFPSPIRSTDAGETWHRPGTAGFASNWKTNEQAWRLVTDPNSPGRLVVATQDELHLSTDAGATFTSAYTYTGTVSTSLKLGLHLAGVFFDGANIYAATNAGLLVSSNGGSFQTATLGGNPIGGIPAGEAFFTFAGASNGTTTRFWAITHDPSTISTPLGHTAANAGGANVFTGFKNIYTLDVGQANWTATANGLPVTTDLNVVTMAVNDIDTVYVGGQDVLNNSQSVYVGKYTTANPTWSSIYTTAVAGNNIVAGFVGPGGHIKFSPAIEGLTVDPLNSSRLMMSDGWEAHTSNDGGGVWQQITVPLSQDHAPGATIGSTQAYNNVGINNTTVWWIHWQDANNIFAAYDDLKWQRSSDAGATWSFDVTGLDQKMENFSIEVAPQTGRMYLAQGRSWGPHDFLGLPDSSITQGGGDIAYSDDGGATWNVLYDFGNPVSWTALDPTDPTMNTMYASVVDPDPSIGGVYVSHNINAVNTGGTVTFSRLAAQPSSVNAGKPHTIEVLNDGTLVLVLTGRKHDHDNNAATPDQHSAGSGVFRLDPGASQWLDVTGVNMHYWCKDLIVDPADTTQQTWYVAVNLATNPNAAVPGQPSNQSGLYMTTDRGATWSRVFTQSADSFAVDPNNPSEAYVTATSKGLWYTSNLRLADGVTINPNPTFTQVAAFPHQRPNRVFFNPYVPGEVWVSSNGAGMFVGNASIPDRTFEFSAANFSVSENDGLATIAVQRTGDNANVMSVDYRVSEGTATNGSDFTSTNLATGIAGTLTFLPGQSTATFSLPIDSDSAAEVDQTVLLSLSGPIGGNFLGTNASATLTILDDDAPSMSDISDQAINEDSTTGAIAFAVSDVQTLSGNLIVSGSSSSTTLVPNGNILFGGSGADRTVTISPAANQFGTATINVTVTDDDGNSVSDSFVLTVTSQNDLPTISNIANQVTNQDKSTGAITFTVDDVETTAGSLMVTGSSSNQTLAPESGIVFGGSGADRTVTITPATGQSGTATITVTVSDGTDSSSDTFQVTVNAVDTLNPTLTVNIVATSLSDGANSSAVTFEFSEAVTGFDAGDVSVSGGMLSNFSGSGASYSATFTADDGLAATGSVSVSAGSYSDAAGNAGGAGTDDVVIDTLNPTLIVNIVDESLRRSDRTSVVTIQFSEVVTGFDMTDVEVSGGTLSDFSGSGSSYSATLTALDEFSGTATVAVNNGTFTDASGNAGIGHVDSAVVLTVSELTIVLDGDQSLEVGVDGQGFVEVLIDNTLNTSLPRAYAAELSTLVIHGSSGSNRIDLSAVSPDSFLNSEGVRVTVNAGDGNDVVVGSQFDDVLNGGDGDDVLSGGEGDNALNGDAGVDTLLVTAHYQATIGATAASGTGADTHAGFERGILEGNEQNNRLNAKDAPFPVTIHGFGGRDTLLAGSFNDTLDGGEGYDLSEMSGSHIVLTDSVAPGADGDVLISIEGLQLVASERGSLIDASVYTLGPVTIVGSSGNDTLKGGSGNDVIMASSGSDVVSGGAGDDFIFGAAGNDDLAGNDGDDRVFGGSGRDTMDGGQGADVLHGGSGADTVQGGDGDDEIQGGSGCDQLDGVDGEDTLVGGGGRNSLAGGTGTDVLNGNVVDNAFQGTVQRDELIGGTRPQERPAPVEYRPDTAEAAKVQVAHPLDSSPSATESDEIDEAFSGSLLPELLTL